MTVKYISELAHNQNTIVVIIESHNLWLRGPPRLQVRGGECFIYIGGGPIGEKTLGHSNFEPAISNFVGVLFC